MKRFKRRLTDFIRVPNLFDMNLSLNKKLCTICAKIIAHIICTMFHFQSGQLGSQSAKEGKGSFMSRCGKYIIDTLNSQTHTHFTHTHTQT